MGARKCSSAARDAVGRGPRGRWYGVRMPGAPLGDEQSQQDLVADDQDLLSVIPFDDAMIARRRQSLPAGTDLRAFARLIRDREPIDYDTFRRDVDAWLGTRR